MNLLRRQHGVTLLELMVAMVISLVLLGGMIQLFVNNKHGYELQNAASRMQENARFAVETLDDSLIMADHWGGLASSDVSGTPAVTGLGSCDAAWVAKVSEGVFGYDGAGTPPLPTGCLAAADYVPNTDVVVVRYATPDGEIATADLANAAYNNTVFLRSVLGGRGQLFLGSTMSGNSDFATDLQDDQSKVFTMPYRVEAYFIRPCAAKGGSSTCTASADGGMPRPTLTRLTLVNGKLAEQPLVDGVEQMQIVYGIDNDADRNVDQFKTATNIAAADWPKVISVRFGLVVRGDRLDMSLPADTQTYSMPGGYSFTPASTDHANHYQRKLFIDTVQIRNRVRG
ncbi:MAG: PilW family protein [Gammaproteobacteria bacterium]|jgi:prepilin-type N-terminal cleavage/methylation domain-containing protein